MPSCNHHRRIRRIGVYASLFLAVLVLGALSGLTAAGTGPSEPGHEVGVADARPSPARPASRAPQIVTAGLTQSGQQLAYSVTMLTPLRPATFAARHQILCLLIAPGPRGPVTRQLCLGARGRRATAVLAVARLGGGRVGPARVIAATITRPSSTQLSASFVPDQLGLGYQTLRWQAVSAVSGGGCAPVQGAPDCTTMYPARPSRVSLHTPRLVGCVARGPSEVFAGPSTGREIALTFDDGPDLSPPTLDFVRLLAREHVPATFFLIGRQIGPDDPNGVLERTMIADGDMIGDHTWAHPDMTRLSTSAQIAQLTSTATAIRRRSGVTPCLWRPPYGAVDARVIATARALGMLTIMWNVDPTDWSLPGAGTIKRRVVSAARPGAIVIQHVGGGPRYQTLAALPGEIASLRRAGYRFVTVAQLLGLRLIYR